MGMIGCLGDVVFAVSSEQVQTITNMQWSGTARHSTHARHVTHALTEFTGLDPDALTFDMVISVYLGVAVMPMLVTLWEYERTAETLPLTIGEHAYGKYRWCITAHKIKVQTYDGHGNLTSATVSVTLQEYLKS